MPTDIEAVEPFPNEIQDSFNEMIEASTYRIRERMIRSQINRISTFLTDRTKPGNSSSDSNLRQRALHDFQLVNGKVHRKPDKLHPKSREVIDGSQVFDAIIAAHCSIGYAGRDNQYYSEQQ